jgi:hypothetical protein
MHTVLLKHAKINSKGHSLSWDSDSISDAQEIIIFICVQPQHEPLPVSPYNKFLISLRSTSSAPPIYPTHLRGCLFLSTCSNKILYAVPTFVLYAAPHFTNYICLNSIIINIPAVRHEAHNYVIFSSLLSPPPSPREFCSQMPSLCFLPLWAQTKFHNHTKQVQLHVRF